MHATPPTPTMPATGVRLVIFGSSKTILRVDQQYPPVICTRDARGNIASCECRETHYEKLCPVALHVGSFCTQPGGVAAQQATPSGGDDQGSCHQLGQSMRYAVQHSILPMPDISQAGK